MNVRSKFMPFAYRGSNAHKHTKQESLFGSTLRPLSIGFIAARFVGFARTLFLSQWHDDEYAIWTICVCIMDAQDESAS